MTIRTMDGTTNMVGQLFLRTPDGAVYGPVDMVTLCVWATDARIIPGCALSADRVDWRPAETFPELRLHWMVQLPDGSAYGPLNLLAVWALADESSIHRGATVVEQSTGRKAALDESSLALLIEESRLMLAGGGALAMGIMEVLKTSRNGGDAALKGRDEQILTLQQRIEGLESDLAASLKLVGETQRYLANQEDATKMAEEHGHDAASLRAERDAVRRQLEDTVQRLQSAAQTEREMLQAQLAETDRRLREAARIEREALQERLAESRQHLQAVELTLKETQESRAAIEQTLQQAKAELIAGDTLRADLMERLRRAEQGVGQAGRELKEALERGKEREGRHAAEVERLTVEAARVAGELEAERAARLSGERARDAEIVALKSELAQWDGKFQEALIGVRKMEADLRAREEAFTAFRHVAERTEAELNSKVVALRKEAESAGRRVQELRELHEQAQREIVQAQVDGTARVDAVKEELAAVQRDLSGLLIVSDCVRQASGETSAPTQASIDWLNYGQDQGKEGGSRLSPAEQLDLLSRKMRDSAEENETLRRTLEGVRDSQEALKREAQEKIGQLQQQAKASSGMVQQALEEIERREAQIRIMRKKAEDREQELLARLDEAEKVEREVVVVEPEVISPRDWGRPAGVEHEVKEAREEDPPDGRNLLNSVEAQLRSELRKWETLSRTRGSAGGQAKKWFARKQS
jgi:chromosome segregation ATPase